jgi:hypothetical protein
MRACLINPDEPISPSNLSWLTAEQQTATRMNRLREKVSNTNVFRDVTDEDIDFTEYTLWKGYYIRNDGTRIVKESDTTDTIREITIQTSNDGYQNVTLNIDGKRACFRMNRLMAIIHHGELAAEQVVDHVDGDILNNAFENLAIVDIRENTRRGASATQFIRVSPADMTIIEHLRCIREYCDANEGFDHRELSQRISTGQIYQESLWFNVSSEGEYYTVDEHGVISYSSIDGRVRIIRERIRHMIETGLIVEDMLPLNGDVVAPTDALIAIVEGLDPRGRGRDDMLQRTDAHILEQIPCGRLLSYFGGTDSEQLVLCLRTMLVFRRSRDNLINSDNRPCPLCKVDRSASRRRFATSDPEMGIPVYSFNHARMDAPYQFQKAYTTLNDAMLNEDGTAPPNIATVSKPLRQSLFRRSTGVYQSIGEPKRSKCRELIWSFYPPRDNRLHEEDPNWLLQRRLNSAIFQALRVQFGNPPESTVSI